MNDFIAILGRDGQSVSRPWTAGSPAAPASGCSSEPAVRGDAAAIRDPRPGPEAEAGLDVLFEGRLDNRRQLLSDLRQALPPERRRLAAGVHVPDADLAVLAFRTWGCRCFGRFLGPFAMVVLDPDRRRLIAARDAVGDRTLCYHRGDAGLLIATDAAAIRRHPSVSSRLDDVSLSRFFAVEAPLPGSTFFADVREVPPGHLLIAEAGRLRLEQYWPPADLPAIRYRDDREYVEHFRSLLVDSVRCRMPSSGPAAVLMSGGLDSTAVAALAADELVERDPDARLNVVSWVFDELPAADERRFMDQVVDRFLLLPHRIRGDGYWPLRDLESWPLNRDAPSQGLYCRLQNKAYEVARGAGATVLLTGEYGDHLYRDGALWLRHLLAEGRLAEGWRQLKKELGDRSLWALARGGSARGAVARAVGYRRRPARPWLMPVAGRLLDGGPHGEGVADPRCAHAVSLELANARRAGIDVRRPYRDRRLIELVLSIPAHLLYRPGWTKWILRQAMEGILPEPVRLRRHVSSLLPLAARGLVDRELGTAQRLLAAPDALWRRYVRSEWLSAAFPSRLRQGRDGLEALVPWQCLCLELWRRRVSQEAASTAPGGNSS